MAQIAWTSHRVLMDRFGEDPGLYAWYAVEVPDEVPEDLSELDEVRERLLDRVARRRSEITGSR